MIPRCKQCNNELSIDHYSEFCNEICSGEYAAFLETGTRSTPPWSLVSYNGREIKTDDDIVWVAIELLKVYAKGEVQLKDQMALSYLESIKKTHGHMLLDDSIKDRFEILDL